MIDPKEFKQIGGAPPNSLSFQSSGPSEPHADTGQYAEKSAYVGGGAGIGRIVLLAVLLLAAGALGFVLLR